MNDLDRLFRQLVEVLTAEDPGRTATPFQLSEIYQSIIPYRKFRKQLGFESNEDYEMAMLRLFAGEADYATVEPDEVKQQLALEAQAVNPNPGAFREFAAARVKLNEPAVLSVRGISQTFAPPPPAAVQKPEQQAKQWAQFAPPDVPTEPILKQPVFEAVDHDPLGETPKHEQKTGEPEPPAPKSEPEPTPVVIEAELVEATDLGPHCTNCMEKLPTNRPVVFCPFCGERIGPVSCPDCGNEIEVGWQFCITCGKGDTND